MALTKTRSYQIKDRDLKQINIGLGEVAGSADGNQNEIKQSSIGKLDIAAQSIVPSKIASLPVTVASVNGVVTLTDDSNTFIVTGSENVTQIVGWKSGTVVIQWAQGRKIVNSTELQLQGESDRSVAAGDMSSYTFFSETLVKETNFFAKSSGEDAAAYVTEATAIADQVDFDLISAPADKNFTIVSVNGIIQRNDDYSLNGTKLTFADKLSAGDFVRVFAITKQLGSGGYADDVFDGGTF